MLTVRNGAKHDWAGTPLPELARGNALDSEYTLRIFRKLEPLIKELGSTKVSSDLYVPLTSIFSKVEQAGMEVDMSVLGEVERNLNDAIIDMEDELYAIEGIRPNHNLGSTVDLREIFYSESGFGFYAPKFTSKDQPSTDKETLLELLSQIEEELDERA